MTNITIDRKFLEEVVELFDSAITARHPHEILRDIRAALAAPATAPAQPAWHDAPTCAGLWLCDEGRENPYCFTTHRVTWPLNSMLLGEGERWFGPIPEDKP